MTIVCVLGLAANSWALQYTGNLTTASGLFANSQWNDPDTKLMWTVTEGGDGLWTYYYNFVVPEKDISHVIIEVSETFTVVDNIKTGTTVGYDGPKLYTSTDQGASNPGMPVGGVWGIKWNTESLTLEWTIVTDRAPMWGDFYSKDGNSVPISYAYSTGFGYDTSATIANGNAMDADGHAWALVPDTEGGGGGGGSQVPEPGTLLLLGAGLFGLAIYGRRKMVK